VEIEVGDEVLLRAKVIGFDADPQCWSAIRVEVIGFGSGQKSEKGYQGDNKLQFWVHRIDQPNVITNVIVRRK